MRNPASITTFLFALIVAGVLHVAHGHNQAEQKREQLRIEKYEAELWHQCKLMVPNSPANQRHCFEESAK